jgi:omega-6 fatty acid desaturase (delta-12 desaturase)
LQHTDPVLPHYSANKWTFARGALATIDRKFMGPIGEYILHGICETHVSHHISSKIPHYNAWEATDALREFLGPHYYRSEENMWRCFYRSYRDCLVSAKI